jgi:membrane-associated protease RseP (regulator of RpoE activity)
MNIKSNVGGADKIARIVIGALLIGLALTGVIGAWGWIGVLPLATGLINFCPAYGLLGINTCKMKK